MRIQIKEYIDFIQTFTERTNIMTKSFYIVVPYSPPTLDIKQRKASNPFASKKTREMNMNTEDFEEARSQLEQRIAVVRQGIVRSGIRAVQLGTEEVIEIFYRLFNPGDVEKPLPNNS